MGIRDNLELIRKQIPNDVKLIAVSKTKPIEDLYEAYNVEQRVFGENKAQELKEKAELMPKDIEWHFIGHLQTNKVKYIVPFVSLIHSIDSLRLLSEVNKEAIKNNRIVSCLMQIDIAHEQTKFGLLKQEAIELLTSVEYNDMKNIIFCGVMGIGSITDDKEQTKYEFRELKSIFQELKERFFSDNNNFREISMGMSDDYMLAIEEGSTMVRIGSSIFGARNYGTQL